MLPPSDYTTHNRHKEIALPYFIMTKERRELKEYMRHTWSGETFLVKSVKLLAKYEGHDNQSMIISNLVKKKLEQIGFTRLAKFKKQIAREEAELQAYQDSLEKTKDGTKNGTIKRNKRVS